MVCLWEEVTESPACLFLPTYKAPVRVVRARGLVLCFEKGLLMPSLWGERAVQVMPVYSLLSSSPGNRPLTSVAGRFLAKREQTAELPSKTDRKHSGTCSCECKAIVESVLVPLARHYVAMGDAARAFYYLLESAAAYLHVSNSYMVSCPACQHALCTEACLPAWPLHSGMPLRDLGREMLGSDPDFFLWFASSAARDTRHCALSTGGISREAV